MLKLILAVLSLSTLLVEAFGIAHAHSSPRHLQQFPDKNKRVSRSLVRRSPSKRCRAKPSSTSTPTPTPTSTKAGTSTPTPSLNPGNGGSNGGAGVINVAAGPCGKPNGSKQTTSTNGPNGQESWLNCGIDASGWTPPSATPSDLIYVPLAQALQDDQSPFKACKDFLPYFSQYGNQYGIPDILLAAIALQESSCNPFANAGTIGLMQITTDKCDANNIRIGTKYLADTLAKNNNNIILTVGAYNGWYPGMTISDATQAAKQGHCAWQQNLDYLQQLFNGWLQNKDAYGLNLGSYFNVKHC
ncbi:lysozyme-like domain-containing protein [Cantharellus anzutake]|uniref:lysozyme-like domain-containing protein n=1 Tax=Cantharellus anzutake TaxID=1750568 RepID=UPI001906C6B9|nr:lysozyme-like domain-containing protein [Cantharellus anzutake]KAF8332080.1 lysozyme-like domain-containing protein [Cantharellus anzutake]